MGASFRGEKMKKKNGRFSPCVLFAYNTKIKQSTNQYFVRNKTHNKIIPVWKVCKNALRLENKRMLRKCSQKNLILVSRGILSPYPLMPHPPPPPAHWKRFSRKKKKKKIIINIFTSSAAFTLASFPMRRLQSSKSPDWVASINGCSSRTPTTSINGCCSWTVNLFLVFHEKGT